MFNENDRLRRAYQFSRVGFGLIAASLLLVCLDAGLFIVFLFFRLQWILDLLKDPRWELWTSTAITWGSVVGMYLLWGRWQQPSWRKRTGLLVVFGGIDLLLWLASHGKDLGLTVDSFGHEWLRQNTGMALGWFEFGIMATLAFDMATHARAVPYIPPRPAEEQWGFGNEAEPAGYALEPGRLRAAQAPRPGWHMALVGGAFWALTFAYRTNWQKGWPLEARPIPMGQQILLMLFTQLLWAAAAWWVTLLSFAASRRCGAILEAMSIHHGDRDLVWTRSEDEDWGRRDD